MQTFIMTTNGGAHPADAWSAQTAAHIVSMIRVDNSSTSSDAKLARRALPRFEVDLADALERRYESHQLSERAALAERDERLNEALVQHKELDAEVALVMEVAKKTPFAAHFADPNTQRVVRDIIQNHLASAQHIERHWHCDRKLAANERNEHVDRFHAGRVAVRHEEPVSMTV